MRRFLVVIEPGPGNFSAYVPDLPGCVATGATREEVEENARAAIALHLAGLSEDDAPVPEPRSDAAFVVVDG